jgi:hypothetical protein
MISRHLRVSVEAGEERLVGARRVSSALREGHRVAVGICVRAVGDAVNGFAI